MNNIYITESSDSIKCTPNDVIISLDNNNKCKYINPDNYRIKGSWKSYHVNKALLNILKHKTPSLFYYKKTSLFNSYLKQLYWSNYKIGYLEQALEENHISNYKIQRRYSFFKKEPILKTILKFIYIISFKKNISQKLILPKNKDYILFIESDFQIEFWESLLNTINAHKSIIIIPNKKHISEINYIMLKEKGFHIIRYEFSSTHKPRINIIEWIRLSNVERIVYNNLFINYSTYTSYVDFIINCKNVSIKNIIVNAGENIPEYHALSEAANLHGIKTYNIMNGIKAGTANNADVSFYKWFIWDNNMKLLLETECNIPSNKLEVVGHLSKDLLINYKFNNEIDLNLEKIKNKIVISFFSPPDLRKDKIDALNIIYKILTSNNNIILLYRPHPSEKKENYYLPSKTSNFIFISKNKTKQSLYDQLFISDLTITIGSTVAMESTWFNTPVITFEQKKDSLLYCIDNKKIKHINNTLVLKEQVLNIKKKKEKTYFNTSSIAKKYIKIIDSNYF